MPAGLQGRTDPDTAPPVLVEGTAVAWGGRAALLQGPSASGKSALALEVMAAGGQLVADDRVEIRAVAGRLRARAPARLAGLVEARGLGLLHAAPVEAEIVVVVDLGTPEPARLPSGRETLLGGVRLPLLHKPATAHFAAALIQYLKEGRYEPPDPLPVPPAARQHPASPHQMTPFDPSLAASPAAAEPGPGRPDRDDRTRPGRRDDRIDGPEADGRRVVLVTGPSGAGRSTAIRVLEDLGFEVIDNLPLSLLPRLLDGPPLGRPLALGLDARNRDWAPDCRAGGLAGSIERLAARGDLRPEILYLDCPDEVLLRRFSETRRRHPLAPEGAPEAGIARERALLAPVRARADVLIDTGALTVHDLRAEVERWYAPAGRPLAVTLESFSYKRGLPPGLDMAFDCRFLRNPHWEAALRPLDGRDGRVAAFVEADPRHGPFLQRITELLLSLLPAYREEGKSHLAIGLGCTGGQHRSVAMVERLAKALAEAGWPVSSRHRELERRAEAMGAAASGKLP